MLENQLRNYIHRTFNTLKSLTELEKQLGRLLLAKLHIPERCPLDVNKRVKLSIRMSKRYIFDTTDNLTDISDKKTAKIERYFTLNDFNYLTKRVSGIYFNKLVLTKGKWVET